MPKRCSNVRLFSYVCQRSNYFVERTLAANRVRTLPRRPTLMCNRDGMIALATEALLQTSDRSNEACCRMANVDSPSECRLSNPSISNQFNQSSFRNRQQSSIEQSEIC